MAASREARRENRSSCSRAWRLLCIAVYTARTCVLASAGVNAKAATSLISLSSILPARLQPGSRTVLFGYIFFSSRIGRHCRSRVRYKLAAFVDAKCKLSPRIYVLVKL
uniref:Secreted protein n=1 Tax=Trichogramma kaykai TaxID=54128 RepID=A0ABD2WF43_9HYME